MEAPIKNTLRIYCIEYYRQARRQNGVGEYPATLYLTRHEYNYLIFECDTDLGTYTIEEHKRNHFMGIPIVVIDEEDKEYKGEINENI